MKYLEEDDGVPFDMISLESLGSLLLMGPIDPSTAHRTCEFILKANILKAPNTGLNIFINSEGGTTNDGFAIIDTIETSRIPVHTIGMGLIASMALLILATGNKGTRTITRNTEIMAHQFAGEMAGKYHELMAVTKEHERLQWLFIQHFKQHSNMNERQIKDILFSPTDRWLTPAECKKYGLVDRVVDNAVPPPYKVSGPKRRSSSAR